MPSPTRAGRPAPYSGRAIQKSFTLDSEVFERVSRLSSGNVSQTVNELLAESIFNRERQARLRRMAQAVEIELDAEILEQSRRELATAMRQADDLQRQNRQRAESTLQKLPDPD
jgi:hypothetical protein